MEAPDTAANLEAQFLAKMATVGDMAAGLAHNLNQPLNNLTVMLHTVERGLAKKYQLSDANLQNDFKQMRQEMQRMTDLVEQVRNLSVHQINDPPERIDLNNVAAEALALILGICKQDQIQVTEIFSREPLPIRAPRARMQLAIYQLLHNAWFAVRAGDSLGKQMGLETVRHGDTAELTVWDTGVGIAPSIESRIFEPFFSTRTVGDGMGLGLSLAAATARQANGELLLQAGVQGQTQFLLKLPLLEDYKPAA